MRFPLTRWEVWDKGGVFAAYDNVGDAERVAYEQSCEHLGESFYVIEAVRTLVRISHQDR